MQTLFWWIAIILAAALLDWLLLRWWRGRQKANHSPLKALSKEPPGFAAAFSSVRSSPEWGARALSLVFGLILILFGQYAITRDLPLLIGINDFSRPLNNWLHVDVANLDNVCLGVALLLAGGWLWGRATRQVHLAETGPEISLPFKIWPNGRPAWVRSAAAVAGLGAIVWLAMLFQLGATNWFVPLLWLLAAALIGWAVWRWDRANGAPLGLELRRAELVLLGGLLVLGLLIGTYQLQNMPSLLMGDEGAFFSTAKSIATGEYQAPVFGSGVYSFPILSSFWQAGILKVFGFTLWSWRFSSVLVGVLAVIPLYFLGRDLLGRRVAVLASLAMITAPYFIAFARLGYNNSQAIFPVTLSAWLMYTGLKRKSVFYLYLGGLVAGVGFLTYTAGRLAVVIAGLYFGYLFLAQRAEPKIKYAWRTLLPLGAAFAIGLALIAVPYYVLGNATDAQALRYKMLESVFINVDYASGLYSKAELFAAAPPIQADSSQLFLNLPIYGQLMLRGLVRSLLVFNHPGLVTEHFIASPLAGPVAVIFYTLGLAFFVARLRERRFALLGLWFGSALLMLSALNTFPPRHQHMVPVIPVMALFIGLGLSVLTRAVERLFSFLPLRRLAQLRWGMAGMGILAIMAAGIWQYFAVVPDVYRPDLESIVNWTALDNPSGTSFVFLNRDPDRDKWKPFVPENILPQMPFATLRQADVLEAKTALPEAANQIIFFDAQDFENTAAILARLAPDLSSPVSFYNREGGLIGGAMFRGRVVLPEPTPWLLTVRDLVTSPVMWIVGLLVLVSIGLAAARPRLNGQVWRELFAETEPLLPPEAPPAPALSPLEAPGGAETPLAMTTAPLAEIAELPQSSKLLPETEPEPLKLAVVEKPARQRFIELEFKLRINLDGAPRTFSLPHTWPGLSIPNWLRLRAGPSNGPARLGWNTALLPGAFWVVLALVLAVAAQFSINGKNFWGGAILYLLAGGVIVRWAWHRSEAIGAALLPGTLNHRMEGILFLAVMAIGVGARFYDLGNKPYGLDGDETKVALQAYYSVVLGQHQGEFLSYFEHTPVSFYLQGWAMRLAGINLLTPRYVNALLSSLAILFFYLLVRRGLGPPVALVAAFLYGISFTALSAGRQAILETQSEIWVPLAYWLLLEAADRRNRGLFFIAGVATAIGMLSSESFYLMPLAALFYLGSLIFRQRAEWRSGLVNAVLFLLPLLFVGSNTIDYIALRQNQFLAPLREALATNASTPLLSALLFFASRFSDGLQTLFFRIRWEDFLLHWDGPFVNPWLLPFFVLGGALVLTQIRRPHFALFGLWFIVQYFPFATLGLTYPRELYVAAPAIYALAALGLCGSLSAAWALHNFWRKSRRSNYLLTGFSAVLVALAVIDVFIFTTRLADEDDRQKRRELADLVGASVRAAPTTYLPYLKFDNDVIEQEAKLIDMTAAGAYNLKPPADIYQPALFDAVMPHLWADHNRFASAQLIFDKTPGLHSDERAQALATILRCYPGGKQSVGKYFDVYALPNLSQPACYSLGEVTALAPLTDTVAPANQPMTFQWQSIELTDPTYEVTVEAEAPEMYWVEAETFTGDGWYPEATFAGNYSGAGYLTDSWQAATATTQVTVTEAGNYTLWVRSYRRRTNDQHNFVALDSNPAAEIARGGEGSFNQWIWEAAGTYALTAGSHTLALSRSYGKDEQFSVFIDAVVLSNDPNRDPGVLGLWRPAFDSERQAGSASQYVLAQGLPPGRYRWRVQLFDDNRLVNWRGEPGAGTDAVEFSVAP